MNYTVVPLTMDDFDAVHALWEESEGIGLHGAEDSREGIEAYLERNPGLSFTACYADHVVGAVLCGQDGRRGYLHHLAVAPAYRRHGIGRALAEACQDTLAAQGIRKCHIFIYNANEQGIAFWQRIGWTQRDDIALMSKNLA